MSKVIGEIFKVTVNDDGTRLPQRDYFSIKNEIRSLMSNKRDRVVGELHAKHQKDLDLLIEECRIEEEKLNEVFLKEYEEHISWIRSFKPRMISYEITIKTKTNNGKSAIFGQQPIFPKENGEYIVDGNFANKMLEEHLFPKGIPYSFSWDWAD